MYPTRVPRFFILSERVPYFILFSAYYFRSIELVAVLLRLFGICNFNNAQVNVIGRQLSITCASLLLFNLSGDFCKWIPPCPDDACCCCCVFIVESSLMLNLNIKSHSIGVWKSTVNFDPFSMTVLWNQFRLVS